MQTKVQSYRLCPKCAERYISTGTVCLLCADGKNMIRDERALREKIFSDSKAKSLRHVFAEYRADRLAWRCSREPLSATFQWGSIRLHVSKVQDGNFSYTCTDVDTEFSSFSHIESFQAARKNAFIHMCRYLNKTQNQFLKEYYNGKRNAIKLARSEQVGRVREESGGDVAAGDRGNASALLGED